MTAASPRAVVPRVAAQAAAAASFVISTKPGTLYGLSGYNAKGSAQFILLFDSASVPAEGAVPVFEMTVPTVSNFSVDFGALGMAFVNGITVTNSSTVATKTIGSADCSFTARFT